MGCYLTATGCHLHMGSHSATYHQSQVNTPALTHRSGMKIWVDLGDQLHTKMVYPPTHPSSNRALFSRESNSQPVVNESDTLTATSPSHLISGHNDMHVTFPLGPVCERHFAHIEPMSFSSNCTFSITVVSDIVNVKHFTASSHN